MPPTQGTCCEVTNDGRESNLVPFCCGSGGTSETLAGALRICFPCHSLENSVPSAFSHKHEVLPAFILIYSYLGYTNQLRKKILRDLCFSGGAFWWPSACCNCCTCCHTSSFGTSHEKSRWSCWLGWWLSKAGKARDPSVTWHCKSPT